MLIELKSVKGINNQKWHGPLSHWCREGKTLVVRPLKKNTFLCVSSHRCSLGFMKRICAVYTLCILTIYLSLIHNQLSERFSGNQLYVNHSSRNGVTKSNSIKWFIYHFFLRIFSKYLTLRFSLEICLFKQGLVYFFDFFIREKNLKIEKMFSSKNLNFGTLSSYFYQNIS